jgi:hypothetical protein
MDTLPAVALIHWMSAGCAGGVVSLQAVVEAGIDVRVEAFPAASNAATPRVYEVPQASPDAV